MKKAIIIILACAIIVGIVAIIYINGNWMIKFKSELNKFFGEDNWEYISEESKNSIIYTEYYHSYDNTDLSKEVPGKYKDWYIKFNNGNEGEICKITNHTFKINKSKYSYFSSKRYSSRQALILELMDIAFDIACRRAFDEIIKDELSENEANCIDVLISYYGGNPKPKFYDKLFNEEWFTINNVNANNFLNCKLHDFYLYIRVYDYKISKLTDEEKQNIFNKFDIIKEKVLEKYGNDVSFEIYFDDEHNVKYLNGIKQ